jgi:hypothetical protein
VHRRVLTAGRGAYIRLHSQAPLFFSKDGRL